MNAELQIGFLIYPGVTQLDVVGASEVLSYLPGAKAQMVWKDLDPVKTDAGFIMTANVSFETCPDLDVICVPGGIGQPAIMSDGEVLAFVKRQGEQARYVTSVCTGSLLLGAAGLLEGYRAACHWAFLDRLEAYGAIPSTERVVVDRNRYSGGGVTSGIDFGLTFAAAVAGEEVAKMIQLTIEYNPAPPFEAGNPACAEPALVEKVCASLTEALPAGWDARWDGRALDTPIGAAR